MIENHERQSGGLPTASFPFDDNDWIRFDLKKIQYKIPLKFETVLVLFLTNFQTLNFAAKNGDLKS